MNKIKELKERRGKTPPSLPNRYNIGYNIDRCNKWKITSPQISTTSKRVKLSLKKLSDFSRVTEQKETRCALTERERWDKGKIHILSPQSRRD